MDIQHLREFVVLAQSKNYWEAAETLFISQSTLSKHIQKIEKEVGVSLFDRTTRSVEINKYGKILLPHAKKIIAIQDQYNTDLNASLSIQQETLSLGSIPALAQYNITNIMVHFKEEFPRSTVNVTQTGSEQLKELLRQKKCDLAFIRDFEEKDDDLVKIPYFSDPLIAVMNDKHPLADQKNILLIDLKDENFLLLEKNSMPYNLSIEACKQSGFKPNIIHTDHSITTLLDLVSKGMGVALLMKQLAHYHKSTGTTIVNFQPTVTTDISLCHLKDIQLPDAAKNFIEQTKLQRTII